MDKEKRVKEIVYKIKKLYDRKYEIQNDLDYDEYYSNDTYTYEGQEEEDEQYLYEIELEINNLEKELYQLTGKKSYFDYIFQLHI